MAKEPLPKELKDFLDTCFKQALDPVKVLVVDEINDNSDFFGIICKAEMEGLVFKFKNFPMTIFKSTYKSNPCIVVLIQLPFREKSKKLSDKVMELVQSLEFYLYGIDTFIYKSKKKDKFTYVALLMNETEEVQEWLKDLL